MDGAGSSDQSRNEFELVEELERLRRRVVELEEELSALSAGGEGSGARHVPRADRRKLEAKVEVRGEFDQFQAQGVDMSTGGLCVEVSEPLPFDMMLSVEDEEYAYRGRMVWMKSLADGSYRLGFRFVPPDLSRDHD